MDAFTNKKRKTEPMKNYKDGSAPKMINVKSKESQKCESTRLF
jgi:hypothetical protein